MIAQHEDLGKVRSPEKWKIPERGAKLPRFLDPKKHVAAFSCVGCFILATLDRRTRPRSVVSHPDPGVALLMLKGHANANVGKRSLGHTLPDRDEEGRSGMTEVIGGIIMAPGEGGGLVLLLANANTHRARLSCGGSGE